MWGVVITTHSSFVNLTFSILVLILVLCQSFYISNNSFYFKTNSSKTFKFFQYDGSPLNKISCPSYLKNINNSLVLCMITSYAFTRWVGKIIKKITNKKIQLNFSLSNNYKDFHSSRKLELYTIMPNMTLLIEGTKIKIMKILTPKKGV